MSRSDEQRVEDILEIAIGLKKLVDKGERDFLSDVTNQWAIERAIHNIGEACTKISDEYKVSHPLIYWKAIIGMRTYLAHAYHRIDEKIVWNAAVVDVPALVVSLQNN